MANISPQQQVSPTEVAQHMHTLVEQGENLSAHPDSAEEEEPLDIDQDDAQSFIQPVLGPAAIRLTSPKTPAAEKAAAMEALPGGGLFRVIDCTASGELKGIDKAAPVRTANGPSSNYLTKLQTRQIRGLSLGNLPSIQQQAGRLQLPSPQRTGSKELVAPEEPSRKTPLSGVFGHTRDRRSFSGGAETFKKIREALPSLSLPSFFSSSNSGKSQGGEAKLPSEVRGDKSGSKQASPSQAPVLALASTRLRECENARTGKLRVWDYGYDWRLSPHLLSRKLNEYIEKLPSNQGTDVEGRGALVIAHSLGGLITRHAVNQRPELYSGVIFAGTPQRCINILGPIRNGDAVLFNEKVLTAQVNFSLRTSFVFLPEDGFCFINKTTGEEFPVDFYDPSQWVKYCWSPCIEPALPALGARGGALGSLRELSGRIPTPLRARGNSGASDTRPSQSPTRNPVVEAARRVEVANDRTLAPQMGTLPGGGSSGGGQAQQQSPAHAADRERNLAYLARTLAETKRFRAETAHRPEHTAANVYPPLAVIYGKDVPTVHAAHVASREAIACADAYDNLVFASGDGVVLAREAQLPPGYDVVRGGRVSTDRGHITMLGALEAVGRALLAVQRGRRKGIGLGLSAGATGLRRGSKARVDSTGGSSP
ncbi:hypothetical protein DL769_011599 [Monosporascus sp. CRB-8-3]|nr:hypothetical protein DL769_011599 [Monosporascus sp. CRB-8-3]